MVFTIPCKQKRKPPTPLTTRTPLMPPKYCQECANKQRYFLESFVYIYFHLYIFIHIYPVGRGSEGCMQIYFLLASTVWLSQSKRKVLSSVLQMNCCAMQHTQQISDLSIVTRPSRKKGNSASRRPNFYLFSPLRHVLDRICNITPCFRKLIP